MTQSTLPRAILSGVHVAILMDGNGRWAATRGRPRSEGHRAGVESVRRVAAAAPGLGISTLTLFAFSADNWQRPRAEVDALLGILQEFLERDAAACAAQGIRMRVIGRRDRLPLSLVRAIEKAEAATASGATLDLRIAVDYSARDSILRAACWLISSLEVSPGEFSRLLGRVTHSGEPSAEVDLLIRTGGERRLSDFLLWECAYAELFFTPVLWPDFEATELAAAMREFSTRERRFGKLSTAPAIANF